METTGHETDNARDGGAKNVRDPEGADCSGRPADDSIIAR